METTGVTTPLHPAFQAGGRYRIEGGSGDRILAGLPAFPETVQVGCDGGLLSHLSVWKNLLLPLEYRGRDVRRAAEDAALLFVLCGEEEANLPRLLCSYPDALSPYERRLVGFVRALLLEPEVLVLDDLFDGFSSAEKAKALRWVEAFRLRFPFRILVVREQGEALSGLEPAA